MTNELGDYGDKTVKTPDTKKELSNKRKHRDFTDQTKKDTTGSPYKKKKNLAEQGLEDILDRVGAEKNLSPAEQAKIKARLTRQLEYCNKLEEVRSEYQEKYKDIVAIRDSNEIPGTGRSFNEELGKNRNDYVESIANAIDAHKNNLLGICDEKQEGLQGEINQALGLIDRGTGAAMQDLHQRLSEAYDLIEDDNHNNKLINAKENYKDAKNQIEKEFLVKLDEISSNAEKVDEVYGWYKDECVKASNEIQDILERRLNNLSSSCEKLAEAIAKVDSPSAMNIDTPLQEINSSLEETDFKQRIDEIGKKIGEFKQQIVKLESELDHPENSRPLDASLVGEYRNFLRNFKPQLDETETAFARELNMIETQKAKSIEERIISYIDENPTDEDTIQKLTENNKDAIQKLTEDGPQSINTTYKTAKDIAIQECNLQVSSIAKILKGCEKLISTDRSGVLEKENFREGEARFQHSGDVDMKDADNVSDTANEDDLDLLNENKAELQYLLRNKALELYDAQSPIGVATNQYIAKAKWLLGEGEDFYNLQRDAANLSYNRDSNWIDTEYGDLIKSAENENNKVEVECLRKEQAEKSFELIGVYYEAKHAITEEQVSDILECADYLDDNIKKVKEEAINNPEKVRKIMEILETDGNSIQEIKSQLEPYSSSFSREIEKANALLGQQRSLERDINMYQDTVDQVRGDDQKAAQSELQSKLRELWPLLSEQDQFLEKNKVDVLFNREIETKEKDVQDLLNKLPMQVNVYFQKKPNTDLEQLFGIYPRCEEYINETIARKETVDKNLTNLQAAVTYIDDLDTAYQMVKGEYEFIGGRIITPESFERTGTEGKFYDVGSFGDGRYRLDEDYDMGDMDASESDINKRQLKDVKGNLYTEVKELISLLEMHLNVKTDNTIFNSDKYIISNIKSSVDFYVKEFKEENNRKKVLERLQIELTGFESEEKALQDNPSPDYEEHMYKLYNKCLHKISVAKVPFSIYERNNHVKENKEVKITKGHDSIEKMFEIENRINNRIREISTEDKFPKSFDMDNQILQQRQALEHQIREAQDTKQTITDQQIRELHNQCLVEAKWLLGNGKGLYDSQLAAIQRDHDKTLLHLKQAFETEAQLAVGDQLSELKGVYSRVLKKNDDLAAIEKEELLKEHFNDLASYSKMLGEVNRAIKEGDKSFNANNEFLQELNNRKIELYCKTIDHLQHIRGEIEKDGNHFEEKMKKLERVVKQSPEVPDRYTKETQYIRDARKIQFILEEAKSIVEIPKKVIKAIDDTISFFEQKKLISNQDEEVDAINFDEFYRYQNRNRSEIRDNMHEYEKILLHYKLERSIKEIHATKDVEADLLKMVDLIKDITPSLYADQQGQRGEGQNNAYLQDVANAEQLIENILKNPQDALKQETLKNFSHAYQRLKGIRRKQEDKDQKILLHRILKWRLKESHTPEDVKSSLSKTIDLMEDITPSLYADQQGQRSKEWKNAVNAAEQLIWNILKNPQDALKQGTLENLSHAYQRLENIRGELRG